MEISLMANTKARLACGRPSSAKHESPACRHARAAPAPSTSLRREGGFTFIEVIVSIAIIAIVVMGYAAMTVAVAEGGRRASDVELGIGAAGDKLEELMGAPIGTLANGTDQFALPTGETLNRSWVVTADQPMVGLTTIAVTVTVPGISGASVRMDSIRRQDP